MFSKLTGTNRKAERTNTVMKNNHAPVGLPLLCPPSIANARPWSTGSILAPNRKSKKAENNAKIAPEQAKITPSDTWKNKKSKEQASCQSHHYSNSVLKNSLISYHKLTRTPVDDTVTERMYPRNGMRTHVYKYLKLFAEALLMDFKSEVANLLSDATGLSRNIVYSAIEIPPQR